MKQHTYFFIPAVLFLASCGIFLSVHPDKTAAQLALHHFWYSETGAMIMQLITQWGEVYLFLAVIALGVYHKRWMFSASFAVTGILTSVVVQVLKKAVFAPSPRPMAVLTLDQTLLTTTADLPMAFAFPSGHTTAAFALFTLLALHYNRPAIQITAAIAACLVAISRVYLMVHWLTDVMAGAVVGMTLAVLVHSLAKVWVKKKAT